VVQTREEQLFDARISLALLHPSRFGEMVGTKRIGHRKW